VNFPLPAGCSSHDPAKGIVLHLDEQMRVVSHQAIGVEVKGSLDFWW
jgi:hypothetical protein